MGRISTRDPPLVGDRLCALTKQKKWGPVKVLEITFKDADRPGIQGPPDRVKVHFDQLGQKQTEDVWVKLDAELLLNVDPEVLAQFEQMDFDQKGWLSRKELQLFLEDHADMGDQELQDFCDLFLWEDRGNMEVVDFPAFAQGLSAEDVWDVGGFEREEPEPDPNAPNPWALLLQDGERPALAVEKRGCTLAQLKDLQRFLESKCVDGELEDTCGKWYDRNPGSATFSQPLRLQTLNWYQLMDWVVLPFTQEPDDGVDRSYCEMVAPAGSSGQEPDWVVSHWWGGGFLEMIQCLERHAEVRKLPETTVYWLSALASPGMQLGKDLTHEPLENGFAKALGRSRGGLCLVLDPDATPLGRSWCLFEVFLRNELNKQRPERLLLDVLTSYQVQPSRFMLDSTKLRDSGSPRWDFKMERDGLLFHTTASHLDVDKTQKGAEWGSMIEGIVCGDWLEVAGPPRLDGSGADPPRYLPLRVDGHAVLKGMREVRWVDEGSRMNVSRSVDEQSEEDDDDGFVTVRRCEVLTDGLGALDEGPGAAAGTPGEDAAWERRSARERSFPLQQLQRGLEVSVYDSNATVEVDYNKILNCYARRGAGQITLPPPSQHARYEEVNRTLRSTLAICAWRQAVERNAANAMGSLDVKALGKAVQADGKREALCLDFGLAPFKHSDALVLAESMPRKLKQLSLCFKGCVELSALSLVALGRGIGRCKGLQQLKLDIRGCGRAGEKHTAPKPHQMQRSISTIKRFEEAAQSDEIRDLDSLGIALQNLTLKSLEVNCGDTALSSLDGFGTALATLKDLKTLNLGFRRCAITDLKPIVTGIQGLELTDLSLFCAGSKGLESVETLTKALREDGGLAHKDGPLKTLVLDFTDCVRMASFELDCQDKAGLDLTVALTRTKLAVERKLEPADFTSAKDLWEKAGKPP